MNTCSRSLQLTRISSATTTQTSLTASRSGWARWMLGADVWHELDQACLSTGVRWQNPWAGERLSGVTVSDGAGQLPGCPQHLQPPSESLQWGESGGRSMKASSEKTTGVRILWRCRNYDLCLISLLIYLDFYLWENKCETTISQRWQMIGQFLKFNFLSSDRDTTASSGFPVRSQI